MNRWIPATSTESISSHWILEDDMVRICRCGIEAETIVCWSDDNPGRRLYVCKREKSGDGCGWRDWKDPKMSDRAKYVICRLRRRLNSVEEKRAREKMIMQEVIEREKKYKSLLVICVGVILLLSGVIVAKATGV